MGGQFRALLSAVPHTGTHKGAGLGGNARHLGEGSFARLCILSPYVIEANILRPYTGPQSFHGRPVIFVKQVQVGR